MISESDKERFFSKVEMIPFCQCWHWNGAKSGYGYGSFRVKNRVHRSHRFSYEIHKGPIPNRLHVLHSCDNTSCVNPDHLWLGTHLDNMKDMASKGRGSSGTRFITHCPRGHQYAGDNLIKYKSDRQSSRICRICKNAGQRIYGAAARKAKIDG